MSEFREYFGKYKGFVRDNADPERRGRVRCYCPQVMGLTDAPNHWTGWAEPCLPWLGGINTLDFGPPLMKSQNGNVEVGVWLEFEAGDVDFPIWVGTWLPAPTILDPNAQQDLTQAGGTTGGAIVDNPPPGSSVSDINPLSPDPNSNETRMLTKKGREILLGSVQGGSIALGPYGVAITGINVTINGRVINASRDKTNG